MKLAPYFTFISKKTLKNFGHAGISGVSHYFSLVFHIFDFAFLSFCLSFCYFILLSFCLWVFTFVFSLFCLRFFVFLPFC